MFEVMENHKVARKFKLKRIFKQWVRGGGLRRMAAAAPLLVVLIFVPNARTESNTALASNADQPTSPGLNCSDRGITLTFTAPTQTSPTVTNYEYFVSLGGLSSEPAVNDAGWKPLSPADSTSPVYISRTTLGLTAATHPNVYYYYLRAVFSDNTKSLSWFRVVNGSDTRTNSVGCSWMGPSIADSVPAAPRSLVATAGSGSASISFTQGDTGTVEGITNYKYSLDGVNYTALSPADTSSPVTIPSLTPGVTYTIYLKAVNSVGDSVASSSVNVVPVSGPPTVTSISPTSGTTAGGTSVTITGTNFISGATVTIGGSSCTSVVVVSSTSITCITPSGTAGSQDVVVATGVSPNATLAGGFTYVAPPAAPDTPDLATASDSGSSSTDDITSDNTPTISVGSAANGNTVTVTATKSGQTNVTCTFTATAQTGCDLGTLVDGVWSVTAKQTASGIDSAATSALSITVDATRPTVTSFSSTKSNGTYGIGTTVNITATLSEPVADGASITVTLDTGDTVVLTKATSTTLTGTYTVGTGDNSADLTVTSYALTSAPTDAVGNAMTSTALPTGASNIAGAQAIVVDTTPPTLRSATANTAGTQVTLTFNEPLNATTAVAGDFVVSVGTTSMTVSSISVSGSTVILTLGTPAAIGDVISVAYTAPTPNSATSNSAIQDIAGNDAISFTTTATVPSAPAPAPAPEPEPTPTTTVAPAPTPTVTPTKASAPKVLECKTAVGSKKSTAPILVGEKLSNGIIFNPDSPILDSTDKRELDRVTGVMAERGGLVLVSGFARKNGFDSAEYLRNLSLARARNVSNYLVAKGVRVSMRYEGYGAVTKDIGTSIERKVELRWIDDSEKLVYEKKCLNQ
jgi:outer membrane protein OmpA-like peptidoglycan-associated protein